MWEILLENLADHHLLIAKKIIGDNQYDAFYAEREDVVKQICADNFKCFDAVTGIVLSYDEYREEKIVEISNRLALETQKYQNYANYSIAEKGIERIRKEYAEELFMRPSETSDLLVQMHKEIEEYFEFVFKALKIIEKAEEYYKEKFGLFGRFKGGYNREIYKKYIDALKELLANGEKDKFLIINELLEELISVDQPNTYFDKNLNNDKFLSENNNIINKKTIH